MAIRLQDPGAFGQEGAIGSRVVHELPEPARVGFVAVLAHDPPPAQLEVPVHARIGRIGRDHVDRLGGKSAQEAHAVQMLDRCEVAVHGAHRTPCRRGSQGKAFAAIAVHDATR
ncbi:hypothetical protein D3C86_1795310 [compost metagenome]